MKTYQADQIKSIALLGNSGSGKTTLAEAMLFNGGIIERRGTIEGKNTVSDYRPIEHENSNSIYSTVLYTEFQNFYFLCTSFLKLRSTVFSITVSLQNVFHWERSGRNLLITYIFSKIYLFQTCLKA